MLFASVVGVTLVAEIVSMPTVAFAPKPPSSMSIKYECPLDDLPRRFDISQRRHLRRGIQRWQAKRSRHFHVCQWCQIRWGVEGATYVGKFKGGKQNGQGTLTSANGDVYVGEFKDDKFDGSG